ncbi:MAG: hypothetical protein FJ333_09455 [Sphingomonadales bacterium]|nr:hypothetical protein [Sphingomonadales bacterium]
MTLCCYSSTHGEPTWTWTVFGQWWLDPDHLRLLHGTRASQSPSCVPLMCLLAHNSPSTAVHEIIPLLSRWRLLHLMPLIRF